MQNPKSLPMVPLEEHQAWYLAPEEAGVQFFPMQVQLQARTTTTLPHHHAGMICALVKAALNTSSPDGILIDYPEQCCTQLFPEETYNFGVTILASSTTVASEMLNNLLDGLRRIGKEDDSVRYGLRGNFDVVSANSLIDGRSSNEVLAPISVEHLHEQIREVREMHEVSLWFRTPLHCKCPGSPRGKNATCFDRNAFFPDVFLRRASKRCRDLGLLKAIPEILPQHVEVVENRLVWQDLQYGSDSTPLTGAAGRIRLRLHDTELAEVLVRAQYARVGEKTNFGFGAFSIEGLRAAPPRSHRSECLVDMSFRRAVGRNLVDLDALAERHISQVRASLRAGTYVPQRSDLIMIPSGNSRSSIRRISVVQREDRKIQALVLGQLQDALAGLYNDLCRASRKVANGRFVPKSLGTNYNQNDDNCAVEARFDQLIASIEHREIEDLLRVCFADDALTDLLMSWIRSGSPDSGRGLPTVSPMTRPLANLFLASMAGVLTSASS